MTSLARSSVVGVVIGMHAVMKKTYMPITTFTRKVGRRTEKPRNCVLWFIQC
jgi:hypothetical protein